MRRQKVVGSRKAAGVVVDLERLGQSNPADYCNNHNWAPK